MEIVGIVLSAGDSRRMGSPKALLDYRGAPFLVLITDRLRAAGVSRVVVAVGQHGPLIQRTLPQLDVHYVTNPDPARGQLSSLQEVAKFLASPGPMPAALVSLVDHPAVEVNTYRQLLDHFPAGDPYAVVRTRYQGKHGHPLLLGSARMEAALQIDPTRQMREVLAGRTESVIAVDVDDAGVRFDVDTPEDYARWVGTSPPATEREGGL